MLVRSLFNLRQFTLDRLSLLKERFKLPKKWKGGRVEKWAEFWENLVLDYQGVATDVVRGAQTKPYKAAFVTSDDKLKLVRYNMDYFNVMKSEEKSSISSIGLAFTAIQTNPDEHSFRDNLLKCVTMLNIVGDPIRNPISEQHIQYLVKCQNQGLLRETNLILFSLVWVADYSKDVDIYAAHCKYLKPRYVTFYQRIIDVGIFGTWWNLRRKMCDYDINNSEWEEKT